MKTLKEAPARSEAAGNRKATLKFVALLLLLGLALVLVRYTPLGDLTSREGALSLIESIRAAPGSAFVFMGIYALAAGFALPGSVLTLVGGALWGIWPGVLINLTAATTGATIAFLLARLLGREFVADKLGARAARLDEKAGEHGFRTIFVLRLVPLVPFNALNYGAGLSAVKLRDYVLASATGMLPGTFAYTYFADSILRGAVEAQKEAYIHMALAGGLLIALSLLPVVWKWWQRRAATGADAA